MKHYLTASKKILTLLLALVLVFSLAACGDKEKNGGKSDLAAPEGRFTCTQRDQGFGDGLEPVEADEFISFNADGTGLWEYAMDSPIEWKLKGDKISIVELVGDNKYSYEGTWDGAKLLLNVDGYERLFEKKAATEPTESMQTTAPAETQTPVPADPKISALAGKYECIGVEMDGFPLDAEGEWLELNADGTGSWFLGAAEEEFEWTLDGDTINIIFTADYGFPATVDGEEIILDTGVLYFFAKEGSVRPEPTETDPETEPGASIWKEPAGYIQIPSEWYGVAIFTEVASEYEARFDVWGVIDDDGVGGAYIELYLEDEDEPVLSMYIDENDSDWLTPVIGDEDAWLLDLYLTEDDEWYLLTMYDEGALEINYLYEDDETGLTDCVFFIREYGTEWDEVNDPLPESYDDYVAEILGGNNF